MAEPHADTTRAQAQWKIISWSDVSALLPSIRDDPLQKENRMSPRMLRLTLFHSPINGITAQDCLGFYGEELGKYTTDELVSMFPEKDFNAFTLIEYLLNFVKVIMVDPKGFTSEAIGVLNYWKSTIPGLGELLKKSSLLDDEQESRVKACFDDIANAVHHSIHLREEAGSGDDTEPAISKPLPLLDTKIFASNSGKEFITRLREIYATVLKEPNCDFLKDIEDLFKRTDLGNITNSDFETDAAMRMIIYMMDWSLFSKCCVGVNLERHQFLLNSFVTLNSSSFPNTTVSIRFLDNAFFRVGRIQAILQRAHKGL